MSGENGKFLPVPTPISRAYWDGCNEKQLLMQQCQACESFQFYPRSVCTDCMSQKLSWVPVSGLGTVASWTIVRHPVSRAYAGDIPYVIALIRLDEGPVMMSQVKDCAPDCVTSGMRVSVVYESWSDDFNMPLFVPLVSELDSESGGV